MPIDRSLYPADWDKIARQVKEEADWICQTCGQQCYRPGEKVAATRFVLTVHPRDHDPRNNDPDNLVALCTPCHLKEERSYQRQQAREEQIQAGQLILPVLSEVTL